MARRHEALRPGARTLAAATWIFAFFCWMAAPAPAAVVNVSNAENIRFDGQVASDWLGYSVDAVGDVNLDGRVDIAIGAPFAGNNGRNDSGSVYVIYGTSSPADLDLNSLGSQGFRIDGPAASSGIGLAVSQAGDFNNDGIDDLMVGGGFSGTSAVYVIWGQDLNDIPNLDLLAPTNPEQARFMRITSTTNDRLGDSLGRVGDFNGDGRGDIVMGAPGPASIPGDRPGSAFVVYGEATSDPLDLSLIATGSMNRHMRITGAITGDQAGYSVAGAGDVNGDGARDVVVGAPEFDGPARSNSGAAYVVYGAAGDPADVSLLQIDGTQAARGFRMFGADADDAAGTAVSPAGDFNGDGRADVAVGAYNADIAGRLNSGAVYVVYGQGAADPADLDLLQAPTGGSTASRAAVLYGSAGNIVSAGGIANVGDFNGDSLTDVFTASTSSNWVAFSEATGDPADLDLNTVNASPAARGYRVDSPHTFGIPGHWISGAGDFDGNGTPDLLVGKQYEDPAGRTDAGSAFLLLDTTAPDTSIDSGPAEGSTINDNTPEFTYSGSPAAQVSRFECTLDGFTRTCPGGSAGGTVTFTTTADGVHTFAIKAVDSNGNTDATAATRTFTIDATPPNTSLGSVPNPSTNDTTPTFGFSSTDGTATFTCRLYLQSATPPAFGVCSGPGNAHTPSLALADGAYRFEVRATDPAQNTDPTPALRDVNIDTVAPTLTINSGPDGPTNDNTPTFGFTPEVGPAVTCAIAPGNPGTPSFSACNTSQGPNTHTAGLGDGTWTFHVRAIDAAGNQTIRTRTFTVDTVLPNVSFTSGPFDSSGPTNDTTPTWGFLTETSATVQCGVGTGNPPSAVLSPCSQTGGAGSFTADPSLSDGPYTAHVRATDPAGNVLEIYAPFTVDTVPPALQITGGPQGPTGDATPEFSYAPEGNSMIECAVTAGNPGAPLFGVCTPGSSPDTHAVGTDLADGTHTFYVRETDAAGNSTTRSRSFSVDTAPPDTIIDSGPSGTTPDATPTFAFHATEAGGTFECRFDSAAFAPCSGPGSTHTPPAQLAAGAHTFLVRASDAVGNVDADPAVRTFLIDANDPPTALITRTYAGGHRLELDGSRSHDPEGAIAAFRWFIDGALVAEKAKTTQEFDPAQASYEVRLVVVDADGARDSATATVKTPVNPDLKKCKLRYARARVFVFANQNRIRLVIRYRSAKPATVFVQFKLRTKRGKVVPLGEVRGRFRTRGLFRLPLKRTDREMRDIRNARFFVASFFVPGTPDICRRAFTRKMNNPRRISGQLVWFQPFGQL